MKKRWNIKSNPSKALVLRLIMVWVFTMSVLIVSIPLDGDLVIPLFIILSLFTSLQLFKLWQLEESELALSNALAYANKELENNCPWNVMSSSLRPNECIENCLECYKKEGQEMICHKGNTSPDQLF